MGEQDDRVSANAIVWKMCIRDRFISFLTIVLLIALFFLRRQTRRRRKALVELHVANGRLKSLDVYKRQTDA